MNNDRLWAAGLTQAEFEREWPKRFPMSDVIPDVKFWASSGNPNYSRLIDGVKAGDVLADDAEIKARLPEHLKTIAADEEKVEPPTPPEEVAVPKKRGPVKGVFPCRGCGKEFEYKVARAGHERSCKVALNTKVEE